MPAIRKNDHGIGGIRGDRYEALGEHNIFGFQLRCLIALVLE